MSGLAHHAHLSFRAQRGILGVPSASRPSVIPSAARNLGGSIGVASTCHSERSEESWGFHRRRVHLSFRAQRGISGLSSASRPRFFAGAQDDTSAVMLSISEASWASRMISGPRCFTAFSMTGTHCKKSLPAAGAMSDPHFAPQKEPRMGNASPGSHISGWPPICWAPTTFLQWAHYRARCAMPEILRRRSE